MDANSFSLTPEERKEGYAALFEFAAGLVLGPIAPFAVLAGRYLYDRRKMIFDGRGRPRAVATGTPDGEPLVLRPALTPSAREIGLRDGDPVAVVVTGNADAPVWRWAPPRRELVVPGRVGEEIEVALPPGGYALGAFAGRPDRLFAEPHPFTATHGATVSPGRPVDVELSAAGLRPRLPVTPPAPPAAPWWTAERRCPMCGRLYFGTLAIHTAYLCPAHPVPAARRATEA
ncbi:hypothetical protein BJF78_21520 [Pseudonocardia sp. CNS-139]|nr:hypothetical protein BJF78_21520 [Pseudonocardia sp. CNS-139]